MSKRIDFYTISMHKDDSIIDYKVLTFFERIADKVFVEPIDEKVCRKIGEKWIRLFSYQYSTDERQLVIPFGKLKKENKPYWLNNEDKKLEEIPSELYDINSLGFDIDYNVMTFTTNREGPTIQNVEAYLNTFIPENTGITLKIEPIMYNTGIEKIRNADLVRDVVINLDLGKSLNTFYINEMNSNKNNTLIKAVESLAKTAKDDSNGKVLSLRLGLGKGQKRQDTLNLESMLQLLNLINIEADFVKEIKVTYKNGLDERVSIAKLKDSSILLSYTCDCNGTQVSPDSLLSNMNNAIEEKVLEITRHTRAYFSGIEHCGIETFNIVEFWSDND